MGTKWKSRVLGSSIHGSFNAISHLNLSADASRKAQNWSLKVKQERRCSAKPCFCADDRSYHPYQVQMLDNINREWRRSTMPNPIVSDFRSRLPVSWPETLHVLGKAGVVSSPLFFILAYSVSEKSLKYLPICQFLRASKMQRSRSCLTARANPTVSMV